MVRGDGSLDRKALAELAFQHNQADTLNHIVHPAVIAAEEEWMRGVFAADPKRVAIVESALIFEVEKWGTAPGWVQRFDKLILVTVPDEVKIARFVARMMANDGPRAGERRLHRTPARGWRCKFPTRKKPAAASMSSIIRVLLKRHAGVVEEIYRELAQAAQ